MPIQGLLTGLDVKNVKIIIIAYVLVYHTNKLKMNFLPRHQSAEAQCWDQLCMVVRTS